MPKQISGLKSSDFRPLRMNMRLFPLASQIYIWCLQVAKKGHYPSFLAPKCAYFSPVSLVSVRVSSFWPRVLSSPNGENIAFKAVLPPRSNEDSLWCLTGGFWVGLFLISQSELFWTKVSTGFQVIPPVSVLTTPYPEDIINHANVNACHGWNHSCWCPLRRRLYSVSFSSSHFWSFLLILLTATQSAIVISISGRVFPTIISTRIRSL